ncbi:phosphoribosylamine--glycine ligase [Spiroplasma litorale]|uniref:Phosphoribosylamine--glycine ligase n=1 Tax=Spiroplasma litorale TaxID=216942 RepID=A0A0K1W319_9MOLU|nr:phosphoribosylamine--glycine ligase [Spiroplasma litorale]AKX34573.1 phosphoribosylamine--glycine ligase [Spiroplasma litorale]
MKKNILILGKGGREHSLARKCKDSSICNNVYVIPGNYGMTDCAIVNNEINYNNIDDILNFVKSNSIDLTIVGDESFLEMGIVDLFDKNNLPIFGPTKKAAQIESSKIFAKKLFEKYQIPTADFFSTSIKTEAINYLNNLKKFPIVIKNDGLASGKGVFIVNSLKESLEVIHKIFDENIFNNKTNGVVIEEFLIGREFSLLALVNEDDFICLQPARDYKKAYDNDKGENTGGMGCYTPVEYVNDELIEHCKTEVIDKTIKALKAEGIKYKGVLYAGLMLTTDNKIKVIEFNSRFGDPETEVLMPALKSDLLEVIFSLLNNEKPNLEWYKKVVLGVTIASEGYPGNYESNINLKDQKIYKQDDIYHMGTKFDMESNSFNSNGGRVLFVISKQENKESCINDVYTKIDKLNLKGFYFRKDIGN